MKISNIKGQVNVPLLALIGVIGIIAFLLVTRSFNFKNPLFSSLYNKPPSQAFDGIQIPEQDPLKTPTSNWTESWNSSPYLAGWNQQNFNCSVAVSENNLLLNCTNGELISKTSFKKDSPVIIYGALEASNNSTAGIGIRSSGESLAALSTSEVTNGFQIPNYQPGSVQNFRIVSSIINNERFIFYYLGEGSQPVKTGPINAEGELNIILSCQGLCSFSPLTISGIPAN